MTDEAFHRYETERFQPRLDWYHRRASQDRYFHRALQWAEILLTAIAPLCALLAGRWLTVAVTSLLMLVAGTGRLFRFEDTWISYRVTCEELQRERQHLLAALGDYQVADDPRALFVQRAEGIMAQEHQRWFELRRKKLRRKGGE